MKNPTESTPSVVRRLFDRYRDVGLLGLALALYVLEGLLPRPAPWFRLGLSNVVILLVLLRDGPLPALRLSVARTLLGSLFLGTLATPIILMNLSGSLTSWLVMSALLPLYPRWISPVGISLSGAAVHAGAQLAAASLLLFPGALAWNLLPVFVLPSLAAGVVVGLITNALTPAVQSPERLQPYQG